jgi:hypothetical protein
MPPLEGGDVFMHLDFFDVRADALDVADLKELRAIKKELGAYSPDVNPLADKILEYLRFCGEHFKSRTLGT